MFSHSQVWAAIDALAERNAMSVSRLARVAGLDPTTFNKSKRQSNDGRLRWPSTESLSKIMVATETRIDVLSALIEEGEMPVTPSASEPFAQPPEQVSGLAGMAEGAVPFKAGGSVPLLGMAQAGSGGFFDDMGYPVGEGWDAVDLPGATGSGAYALEISGDSMLPLYRDGDRIIVEPGASIRRGDRVVVRTVGGEVMAKVLARQTALKLELSSLNPEHEDRSFALTEIDWVARIVWASQ